MELIRITADNLEKEHICCAIASAKDPQVAAKKAWLAARLADGLVFLKGNVRGKCFIEYLPSERAWAPVEAPGAMMIDCFWVSGQLQGHGNATLLLNACIDDCRAKGKTGLAVLSSPKKRPFLSDPGYLRRRGFVVADRADPWFELLWLPLTPEAEPPRFRPSVRGPGPAAPGFTLYYSHQCPYTAKYVPVARAVAEAAGVSFQEIHLKSAAEAQACPSPWPTYSLFYHGAFVTNEIQSGKKMAQLIDQLYR